ASWRRFLAEAQRRGVRLGIDVGTVRIGVARSDPHGLLATPVRTITRTDKGRGVDGIGDIAEIAAQEEAMEVFVGLPRHLSGREGASADLARRYAESLAAALPIPVRLIDERLTTVSAHQAMRASGRSGRK